MPVEAKIGLASCRNGQGGTAAGIVAISLVDLCLQHRSHVPRLNTDHG